MSKEDQKKKELKDIEKGVNDLTNSLNDMADKFGNFDMPLVNLNDMEKTINSLKDIIPKKDNTTDDVEDLTEDDFGVETPPVDGETCMHGSSWHSNCSDCDDMDDKEVVLNEIENLIKTEPNDKELGKKIRDFYNKFNDYREDKEETTNNIDI